MMLLMSSPTTPDEARAAVQQMVNLIGAADDPHSPDMLVHVITTAARLGEHGFDSLAHTVLTTWMRATGNGEEAVSKVVPAALERVLVEAVQVIKPRLAEHLTDQDAEDEAWNVAYDLAGHHLLGDGTS